MNTQTTTTRIWKAKSGRELVRWDGERFSILQGSSGYATLAELRELERAIENAAMEVEYPLPKALAPTLEHAAGAVE